MVKRSADFPMTVRPVVAFEDDYPAGFVDPMHSHDRSQLCYAASGVMSFTTDAASFILPPKRAIWIPAGVRHQLSCRGPVMFQTLYIEPACDREAHDCRVLEVSMLIQALIGEVARFGPEYDVDGREGRIVSMLLDELKLMPSSPVRAAMPGDPRLRRVCEAILADTADQRSGTSTTGHELRAWGGAPSLACSGSTRAWGLRRGASR